MISLYTLLRFIGAVAIIASGITIYQLGNRWILHRASKIPQDSRFKRQGKPTLLYFTTPTCVPCKTVQRPAIERLQRELGDGLQVIEIDAAAQPDQADRWGVLSVPTTILLDPAGKPRHINHGVAPAEKLRRQIVDLFQE